MSSMRFLFIGEQEQERAAKLVEYAAQPEHRVTATMTIEMLHGKRPPIGDDGFHVLHLVHGYRCVFSIDQGLDPKTWYRHLSVSVDGGQWPKPQAVDEIMQLFGFKHKFQNRINIYTEDETRAISVMEEYEEDKKPWWKIFKA